MFPVSINDVMPASSVVLTEFVVKQCSGVSLETNKHKNNETLRCPLFADVSWVNSSEHG